MHVYIGFHWLFTGAFQKVKLFCFFSYFFAARWIGVVWLIGLMFFGDTCGIIYQQCYSVWLFGPGGIIIFGLDDCMHLYFVCLCWQCNMWTKIFMLKLWNSVVYVSANHSVFVGWCYKLFVPFGVLVVVHTKVVFAPSSSIKTESMCICLLLSICSLMFVTLTWQQSVESIHDLCLEELVIIHAYCLCYCNFIFISALILSAKRISRICSGTGN